MTERAYSGAEARAFRHAEQARVRRRAWVRAGLVVVAVIAVALVASGLEAALTAGRIHPGVSVSGVDVGGMSVADAQEILERELPQQTAEPVVVVYEDSTWTVTESDVGLVIDYDETLDAAWGFGRDGGAWTQSVDRVRAWVGGTELAANSSLEPEKAEALFDDIQSEIGSEPRDASVVIDGTNARLEPARTGMAVQRAEASEAVAAAFLSESREVVAPVAVAPVRVTDENAQDALEAAKSMLSGEATISWEDKSWSFEPKDIAGWISFETSPSAQTTPSAESAADTDAKLVAFIDPEKADPDISDRVGDVGKPARDARFRTSGGEVSIEPSQDGLEPDVEALCRTLTVVLADPDAERAAELRTKRVEPRLTTERARELGITERISTYTTTFAASNKPRVNNIHLLAQSIDGTLLAPGETFSLNEEVGPRTAAKGYSEAPAIVGGKLVPSLGGGICQVTTTLFNTVFESGLPVAERRNHSFYISHYPRGRDATVSWGGPDFKFTNDTDEWLLLAAGWTDGSVTISLYGTDPGYEVSSEVSPWADERPYPVEEIKDPELAKGARVVMDGGVKGRTIVVKRVVRSGDRVVREDAFKSVYRPKAQVVRVGTKAPAKQTETATPEPATP